MQGLERTMVEDDGGWWSSVRRVDSEVPRPSLMLAARDDSRVFCV